jgi:hypothetical protein
MKTQQASAPQVVAPPLPEEIRAEAEAAGWPDGLVDRLGLLHFPPDVIRLWLRDQAPARAERGVKILERLAYGTLRLRDATYAPKDLAALADLFSNAPEDIGDWEVTVERSPDPIAQFALQHNHRVRVLEDRGLFIGAFASSARETFVGGRPMTVNCMSGYRIRSGFRGQGLSQVLSWLPPAVGTPYSQGQWFHIRSQNHASVQWMNALSPEFLGTAPQREDDVPGIEVYVNQYPAQAIDADATGIRKISKSDVPRCVNLINRTQDGLDLFTPYTEETLTFGLNERIWGPTPDWWGHIYGWDDYYVLEEGGRIVACAGLWDKGANVREHWRLKSTGDEKLIDTTALVEFGFEEGREDAMARLGVHLIGETARIGRGYLVAALQFHPEVAALLEEFGPIPERRGLIWRTFDGNFNQMPVPDPAITRPYTDLFYW